MTEIKDANLKGLLGRAEAAQRDFEEKRARLYRADGQPLYGESEMRERLADLREERREACEAVVEEARRIRVGAEQAVRDAENSDPLGALTTDELARANAMRGLAADAVEALDVGGLERRLRSVLAGGDRGQIGAYYAAGSRRARRMVEASRERAAKSGGPGSAATSGIAARYASSPLDEVLGEMREALDRGRSARDAGEERALAEEASQVEIKAGHLKVGARNFAQAWANELRVGPAANR